MDKAPYEGHYTAARNPNSTMLRVLSNVGFDITLDHHRPSMVTPSEESGYDVVVAIEIDVLSKDLLAEAEEADFEFYEARPSEHGRLTVRFGVKDVY